MRYFRWNRGIKFWSFFFILISIFLCGCGRKNIETTVSGSVLSIHNQPIAHAMVFTNATLVMTDAEGLFEFKESSMPYKIHVQAVGYESYMLKYKRKPLTFRLKPLEPGNADVIVRDSRGMPLGNASVVVFDSNSLSPVGIVQTSQDGLVRLKNVPTGTLLLAILNKGFEPQLRPVNIRSGKIGKIETKLLPCGTRPAQAQVPTAPAGTKAEGGTETVIQLPIDPDVLQPGQNQSISYRSTNEWDFSGGTLDNDAANLGNIRRGPNIMDIYGNSNPWLPSTDATNADSQPSQTAQAVDQPVATASSVTSPQGQVSSPITYSTFVVNKEINAAGDNINLVVRPSDKDQGLIFEGDSRGASSLPRTQESDSRVSASSGRESKDIYISHPEAPMAAAEQRIAQKELQALQQTYDTLKARLNFYHKEIYKIHMEFIHLENEVYIKTPGNDKVKHEAAKAASASLRKKYEELNFKYNKGYELAIHSVFYEVRGIFEGGYYKDEAGNIRRIAYVSEDDVKKALEKSRKARAEAENYFSS